MRRRQFLAVLGVTGAAGCTAETSSTGEQPTTVRTTTRTTMPPTATRTTAEATTDRSTDRSDPTSTRGAELIDSGRTHLRAAIDAFTEAAAGPEPTIVDVSAATADYSRFDLHEEYRNAKDDLTEAKKFTSGERTDLAEDLLEVAEFVNELGFAQIHLVNSFREVSRAVRSFYTENYGDVPDNVDDVVRQRDAAADYAESIHARYDESTFAVVDSISGEQFRAKLDQMNGELAAFEGIAAQMDRLETPMVRFEEDVYNYRTQQYEGVVFESNGFEDILEGLAAIKPPASLRPVLGDLTCLFGALVDGVDVMRDALLARLNGNHGTARELERDAEATFESCPVLVEEIEPVAVLVD